MQTVRWLPASRGPVRLYEPALLEPGQRGVEGPGFGIIAMALLPDRPLVAGWAGWDFFFLGLLTTVARSLLFGGWVPSERRATPPFRGNDSSTEPAQRVGAGHHSLDGLGPRGGWCR